MHLPDNWRITAGQGEGCTGTRKLGGNRLWVLSRKVQGYLSVSLLGVILSMLTSPCTIIYLSPKTDWTSTSLRSGPFTGCLWSHRHCLPWVHENTELGEVEHSLKAMLPKGEMKVRARHLWDTKLCLPNQVKGARTTSGKLHYTLSPRPMWIRLMIFLFNLPFWVLGKAQWPFAEITCHVSLFSNQGSLWRGFSHKECWGNTADWGDQSKRTVKCSICS